MTAYEMLNKGVVVLRFPYDVELRRIERILSIEDSAYASPALVDVRIPLPRSRALPDTQSSGLLFPAVPVIE